MPAPKRLNAFDTAGMMSRTPTINAEPSSFSPLETASTLEPQPAFATLLDHPRELSRCSSTKRHTH